MTIFAFNFFEWLAQNQMIYGGLTLAAVGLVVTSLRKIPVAIYDFLKRRVTVTLDIEDGDEAFQWIGLWLAQRGTTMRDVSVITKQGNNLDNNSDFEDTFNSLKKDNRPKIFLTPAPGTHFSWYRGRVMIVYRKRQDGGKGQGGLLGNIGSMMKTEGYVITFLSFNSNLPKLLLEDARNVALPTDGKIDVRISQAKWYSNWQLVDRIRPRSIDSVILSNNEHLKILEDIKEFLNSYKWYSRLGIPYRRGYLLYGEPGGGKTSLVVAVASSLGMNICILSLQTPGMTDSTLIDLLNSVSSDSVILIEDVDCAFAKRDKKEDTSDKLTFSGLLNALDGVGGKDGRIVFMTTNHREKLDKALIRPGRIDYQVEIKKADKQQVGKLFDRFYEGKQFDLSLRQELIDTIPDYQYSMAKLQGFFMKYKNKPSDLLVYRQELDELDEVSVDNNLVATKNEAKTLPAYHLVGLKNSKEKLSDVESNQSQ